MSEDKDYILFAVIVFKKFVDDFKTKARERKFIVREFEYHEEEIESERQERTQLGADLKKQLVSPPPPSQSPPLSYLPPTGMKCADHSEEVARDELCRGL